MNRRSVGNVLAEGEATGHHHRVTVAVMEREDKLREFEGPTIVTHEEHTAIELPRRKYISAKVIEVDYLAAMATEQEVKD